PAAPPIERAPSPRAPGASSPAAGGTERDQLLDALQMTGWNVSRAAARLGISRNTIRYRLEKYRILPPRSHHRPPTPARPPPPAGPPAPPARPEAGRGGRRPAPPRAGGAAESGAGPGRESGGVSGCGPCLRAGGHPLGAPTRHAAPGRRRRRRAGGLGRGPE